MLWWDFEPCWVECVEMWLGLVVFTQSRHWCEIPISYSDLWVGFGSVEVGKGGRNEQQSGFWRWERREMRWVVPKDILHEYFATVRFNDKLPAKIVIVFIILLRLREFVGQCWDLIRLNVFDLAGGGGQIFKLVWNQNLNLFWSKSPPQSPDSVYKMKVLVPARVGG